MKARNLARTDSLARSSTTRYYQQAEGEEAQATMSLDQYFISLGRAAKALWLTGAMTGEEYQERLTVLKVQYQTLKALAA